MGRIRTIKPEFFTHEELSRLPADTHLFAAGLLCYADDEGYFNANEGLVKAAIFPLRESSLNIHDMLAQLVNLAFLRLGETLDGKRWGQVVNFSTHQRVNRPTLSKIKDLSIVWNTSPIPHTPLSEASLPEGKGKEQGKEQGKERKTRAKKARLVSPSPAIPDWIPATPWEAFTEMRKDIHAPLTEGAVRLAIGTLAKLREQGNDPAEVLNQSTLKSWRGLFAVKDDRQGARNGHGNHTRNQESVLDRIQRERAEAAADPGRSGASAADAGPAAEPTPGASVGSDPPGFDW